MVGRYCALALYAAPAEVCLGSFSEFDVETCGELLKFAPPDVGEGEATLTNLCSLSLCSSIVERPILRDEVVSRGDDVVLVSSIEPSDDARESASRENGMAPPAPPTDS